MFDDWSFWLPFLPFALAGVTGLVVVAIGWWKMRRRR